MARLKLLIILFLTLAVGTASSQKHQPATSTEDRDPSGLLREVIAARGVDRWAANDVLMGLTRPPMQPVQTIPEWEKARAVLFALDSEMLKAFSLNRRIRTTNSPGDVYGHKRDIAEVLNELICQRDEAADQDADSSDSGEQTKILTEMGCEEGELDSVGLERYFDELAIAHDFVATVARLTHFVDVVLLVNSSSSGDLDIRRLIDNLKTFDAARDLLASPHLFFVQAPFDTKWIRDYGPLFVRDSQGAITSVDTRYDSQSTSGSDEVKQLTALTRQLLQRNSSDEAAAQLDATTKRDEASHSRLKDDQIPTVLAPRFRQRDSSLLRRYPVSVVRPPIALAGGDFLTDGMGTGFTSLRTLRDNGGNVEVLDLNFKKYIGIENLVYLHPLPGETVKHIDMFLQAAAPNVLLLGKFSRPADNEGEGRLQSAAANAMEDNLAIIRDHYQRMGKSVKIIDDDTFTLNPRAINIVRVPMPPVARPFANAYEGLVRDLESATRDYDEHSILLRLVSRFQSRLEDLKLEDTVFLELRKEASEKHPADEHDLEFLNALNSTETELGKIIIRYSSLSAEYGRERDHVTAVAGRLQSALKQLLTSARETVKNKQSLNAADLQPVATASAELAQICDEFMKYVQGDREKDASLAEAGLRRAVKAAIQMQKMQSQYQYGTDLYRTYLNLLPVRTPNSFVLVVPSYRDPALQGDGESATKRIVAVYRQLYGAVELVPAPSDAFIKEAGSIHCLTKVVPEGVDFLTSERNRALTENRP